MNTLNEANILQAKQDGIIPILTLWELWRIEREKQREKVGNILESNKIVCEK